MIVRSLLVFPVLAGSYLFFAGDVSEAEAAACVVCASLGTALAGAMSWTADRRFSGPTPARAIARPLASLLPETFIVGRDLVAALVTSRGQRGTFVRQPFDPGESDDASTAGRRAMVILGISLAPRTFVVRGEASNPMILHALPAKKASPDTEWPA